jgi:Bacteriophage T4-like portal protein (Gp20)
MSWKKYFKASNTGGALSPINGSSHASQQDFKFQNYGSLLPEVYMGHPNRIERYNQYESMDLDSEVNSALDIISEFCTQVNEQNHTVFDIQYNTKPTETEVNIIKKQLQAWTKLNQLDRRAFRMFRNVLKYGDQIFVRDPETFKLLWVDMSNVTKIIVNESDGKVPEQYVIRNINPNLEALSVTQVTADNLYYTQPNTAGYGAAAYNTPNNPYTTNSRFVHGMREITLDAEHVLHLSLTEGLDPNWPFGNSILENIFKVYKQKELLEDAIVIYRVQRAPERRVFKIDVGNMPSHLAMAFVDRVKNEIHQRRIPTQNGGQSFMDSTYNPLCLDLNTRIPLLDGRTLSLSELIKEFQDGKENWAYSCNPATGKIVPGVINWAGVTKTNAEVIKLTLDNGETLVCTPEHKIPVFGKGFVEAQHLTEQDSLIAFNARNRKISGGKTNDYQQVWDHEDKQWIWTHQMVGDYFRNKQKHQEFTFLEEYIGAEKTVIHHKNYDRFNNDPRNLVFMNQQDHALYHASEKKQFWENLTFEQHDAVSTSISQTLLENWKNVDNQTKKTALYNIRQAQKISAGLSKIDPVCAANYKTHKLANRVKFSHQQFNLPFRALQIVSEIVNTQSQNKNQVMQLCAQNSELMTLLSGTNSGVIQKKDWNKFSHLNLNRLLKINGYKNWKTFVKEVKNFNHRIVKIETVEPRDVGTITIDGTERWHNYHTFAIESGIFVKNSVNEDYFFPHTAEGRGSSVELLPGGQNLGEIDDLKFFTNKMFRGLRIPSSYLPTGAEDSTTVHNDGKVATALIQEHRFNQYCKRLQALICTPMDTEFKAFLKWRGFNLDNTMFELKMNEPQNFAKYRQASLDSDKISSYSQLEGLPYMSKRFLMKRYLGLTEEELLENSELWREENSKPNESAQGDLGLQNVGITPGSLETDLDSLESPTPAAPTPAAPAPPAGPAPIA